MSKPRTLNVDRMRRYVAHTSPDVLRFSLPVDEFAEAVAQERLDHWSRLMRVKYGESVKTTAKAWLEFDRQVATREARVVK